MHAPSVPWDVTQCTVNPEHDIGKTRDVFFERRTAKKSAVQDQHGGDRGCAWVARACRVVWGGGAFLGGFGGLGDADGSGCACWWMIFGVSWVAWVSTLRRWGRVKGRLWTVYSGLRVFPANVFLII